jgi:hypothetical protein
MEMRSDLRLDLARNFRAMPLRIRVLLGFDPICNHERAFSARILHLYDGHYLGCSTLGAAVG